MASRCGGGAPKVPVTILTGFLGSGKTTLMNHILSDPNHGMKFAIIENEYGDVNIDADLVGMKADSKEEIIEMVNGCICCNVRGDLVPVVKKLLERKDKFDAILIETTGMADPAPVIQTFFLDADLARQTEIDGVVTVVDAKHVVGHLHEKKEDGAVNETEQQLAFADRILLNKIDLVTADQKADVRAEMRTVNKTAEIIETHNSVVDPTRLIGIKAFDLKRAVDFDPTLLEEEEVEAKGTDCSKGCCSATKTCPSKAKENSCCVKKTCGSKQAKETKGCGGKKPKKMRKVKHDTRISSIAFNIREDMDISKLQRNLGVMLSEKSENMYRYKGVLSVMGMESKFVFQGVHMLCSAGFIETAKWKPDEERRSKFVFIGLDLNHDELADLFNDCVASALRFEVGDAVMCRTGTWAKGTIIKKWDEGNPYRIRCDDGMEVWAPQDTDDFVKRQ